MNEFIIPNDINIALSANLQLGIQQANILLKKKKKGKNR